MPESLEVQFYRTTHLARQRPVGRNQDKAVFVRDYSMRAARERFKTLDAPDERSAPELGRTRVVAQVLTVDDGQLNAARRDLLNV